MVKEDKVRLWTCVFLLALLLVGEGEAGRFGGRGGGGRRSSSSRSSSSSSRGSSWFGSRGSSSSGRKTSSGQGWAGSSGSSGGAGSYPKQQWSSGGKTGVASNVKPGAGGTALGGGGFVNPNRGGAAGGYGSRGGGYGSRYGAAGAAGGLGAGAATGGYSYRSPGYGTSYGTSFAGGRGRYGSGPGFSKKALGLGVGAGFLGGAALGVAGSVAMYGVYHRYNQYRMMMMMHGGGYNGYNQGYHNNYYSNNRCFGGCPMDAHCEWGFCECNQGTFKRFGRCERGQGGGPGRPKNFDPFITCGDISTCQRLDVNLICNTNLTTGGEMGKCECRQDMKWNVDAGECQLFLDVDCSSITYDSKPSPVILEAVNKTLDKIAEEKESNTTTTTLAPPTTLDNSTVLSQSPNETLANSLLSSLDPVTSSEDEIKEAYCRDIDSFSWEFNTAAQTQEPYDKYANGGRGAGAGSIIGIVVAVLIFFALCCACGICCAFKGAKDKISGAFKSSPTPGGHGEGVVMATVQDQGLGYHPNPGFQPQPTPQHMGGQLPYGLQPTDPAPIPPTQPGYTNTYPPLPSNDGTSPYPPQPSNIQYPPQPANGTYPPQPNDAPYPPMNQPPAYAPYNQPPSSSPYPPITSTPYPANSAPYPPMGQPAYNPTAPP